MTAPAHHEDSRLWPTILADDNGKYGYLLSQQPGGQRVAAMCWAACSPHTVKTIYDSMESMLGKAHEFKDTHLKTMTPLHEAHAFMFEGATAAAGHGHRANRELRG